MELEDEMIVRLRREGELKREKVLIQEADTDALDRIMNLIVSELHLRHMKAQGGKQVDTANKVNIGQASREMTSQEKRDHLLKAFDAVEYARKYLEAAKHSHRITSTELDCANDRMFRARKNWDEVSQKYGPR